MAPSQSNCFLLSNVLKVYFQYATPAMIEEGNNPEVEERKLRELVINLQCAGSDDETIYDELVKCNYSYGCPLALYEEFYEASYCYVEDIAKASKKVDKEVKEATARAHSELSNKRKCAKLECEVWAYQTQMSQTTISFISPAEKKSCWTNDIDVGCYVRVEPNLSPGNNSHGGVGYVVSTKGDGADRTSSVWYLENYGAQTEKHVLYSRLTDLGHPLLESGSYSCRRSMPTADDDQECMAKKKQQSPRYLHEILSFGYSKNFAFGWRARELGFDPKIDKRSERFRSILCQDARELQGFLAATPKAGKHLERKQNGNFKANKGKFNPLTMRYLVNAWGVSYHMPFNLLQSSNERKTKTVSPMQQSIINRFASAKVYFTGRNLFIQDCVRCQNLAYANLQEELAAEQSPDGWKVARQKQMYIWHEEAKGECISIDSKVREVWES